MPEEKGKKSKNSERAVGRRKTAAARVRISLGKGKITVNGKDYKEYFPVEIWQQKVVSPLKVVGREAKMDVSVKVVGGGSNGQTDAVRHGIARALVKWDETFKSQ
jgi:small subunit ribosomal protein S9